jgi:hypothetical protein
MSEFFGGVGFIFGLLSRVAALGIGDRNCCAGFRRIVAGSPLVSYLAIKGVFQMNLPTPEKSDPEIASIGGNRVYVSRRSRVFGIYRTAAEAESAVDRLLRLGLTRNDIAVLHPENESTREFARRKGTRLPAGTAHGRTALLPLDGTLGLRDPAAGPVQGALPLALADMGVPADWCQRRVVHGKVLISVESSQDDAQRLSVIMGTTGAEDVDWVDFERSEVAPASKQRGEKWPEIGSRNNGKR